MKLFMKNKPATEIDSKDVAMLYGEATYLADYIVEHLKKTDLKLKEGITLNQYDIFMRISMYILKLKLFDTSKYSQKQLQIIQRIYKMMSINYHTFFLMHHYKVDKIYGRTLDDIEKMYQEKIDFCDYMFLENDDKSLMSFAQTPASLFGLDYINNSFIEVSESSNYFKNGSPSQEELYFMAAVINGTIDYYNKYEKQIDKKIKSILKKY